MNQSQTILASQFDQCSAITNFEVDHIGGGGGLVTGDDVPALDGAGGDMPHLFTTEQLRAFLGELLLVAAVAAFAFSGGGESTMSMTFLGVSAPKLAPVLTH